MSRIIFLFISLLIIWRPAYAEAISVPIETQEGAVIFQAALGEKDDLHFLIDTGFTPSAVDIKVARKLGLDIREDSPVIAGQSGGEAGYVFPTVIVGLVIGGTEIGPQQAMAMDLRPVSHRLGRKIDGILGYGFLRNHVTRINYAAGELRAGKSLAEVGVSEEDAVHKARLTLVPGDFLPMTDILVQGRPMKVSIDTGAAHALEIFSPAVTKFGLTEMALNWQAGTADGSREGSLPGLRLGPFMFTNVPTSVTPPRGRSRAREGNIGNGLLFGQDLTLDYIGRRILFMQTE